MKVLLLLCASLFAAGAQYPGWWVPPGGVDEKSPLTATPATIARGKELFAANCARCHGPDGKGSGPESAYAADLTDDLRIELNTEGVLFYKIWKGRVSYGKGPREDMPSFEGRLEKAQVWALIEYLKVLRTPGAAR
jgi:mono/diheme cytochrome c family protein